MRNIIYEFYLFIKTNFINLFTDNKLKKRIIFNSVSNEYSYNSKYLFEYILKNNTNSIEIKFIVRDNKEKRKLKDEIGDYFISNTSIKDISYILKSKLWVTSSLDLPCILLLKNKNRIVYHIGHGIPMKNIGLSERKLNIFQYFNRKLRIMPITHVLCYSLKMKNEIYKIFQKKDLEYLYFGEPRNDVLINQKEDIFFDKNKKYILYAPTWRKYEKVKFFPFSDIDINDFDNFLEKNNIVICLREHPYYKGVIDENLLKIKNIKIFNNDKFKNIDEFLKKFEILITDYSSIYFDFLCFSNKVIFIPYDLTRYEREVGFLLDFYKFTSGKKVYKYRELKSSIIELLSINYKDEKSEKIKDILNLKLSNNCLENFEFIEKLLEEVE